MVDDGTPGSTRAPVEVELDVDVATPVTFSELYEDRFLPLVRLATLLTGRVEVARDIVQDAFVQLHVRWATVRDPLPYVRRSVVNGCRSHHRKRLRRGDVSLADHELPMADHSGSTGIDHSGIDHSGIDHTFATLAVLTPKQRACVVLKYYEGRTEREIADLVGIRPGSVGPTLHRALAKLRDAQA